MNSMKRVVPIAVVFFLALLFGYTLWFLYQKSRVRPVAFAVERPRVTEIVKKTVASGSIVPRKEVELKPRVPGIIDQVFVAAGQRVQEGQLVAKIQVVPDTTRLAQAQATLNTARINAEQAAREFARVRKLHARELIADAEYRRQESEDRLRRAELQAALDGLQVVRKGASRAAGLAANTEVHSTVNGTVLDVPIKEGMSVIESNTFNAGSTIAVVADMSDMIFEGNVDESEVGKLAEGMPLQIRVAALPGVIFAGTLEHIAPKAQLIEGAIRFKVRAAIVRSESQRGSPTLRAGYSANADIVLDRAKTLAIDESLLKFDGEQPYVEVEVAPQKFERREVTVGISDGIHIQIKNGLNGNARIKGSPASGS